jgi:3-isopropylmalate/(R)-2-methylmalate dehydratase small subunit
MQPFTTFTGRMVVLLADNIDTDQIIPARFLTTISKTGLGQVLFYGWRYHGEGKPHPDFPLNQPLAAGAQILVAGDNFGSGSSREHASWALMDFGFRAVIATSFADIFRNNALKNGLLPVAIEPDAHRRLLALLEADPAGQCTVDLAAEQLTLPDGTCVSFLIDSFSRTCLLEGVDELGYLLKQGPQITAYEETHAARVDTGTATTEAPC